MWPTYGKHEVIGPKGLHTIQNGYRSSLRQYLPRRFRHEFVFAKVRGRVKLCLLDVAACPSLVLLAARYFVALPGSHPSRWCHLYHLPLYHSFVAEGLALMLLPFLPRPGARTLARRHLCAILCLLVLFYIFIIIEIISFYIIIIIIIYYIIYH